MSAPTFESMESEYINYGFLSVKAGNAIKAALEGQNLSEAEGQILKRAEEFLKDISSGAVLVKTGRYNGVNPSEAMAALDFAMNPILHLQDVIKNEEVSKFFDEMADAIQIIAAQQALPDEKKGMLGNAQKFFDYLYSSLLDSLNSGRPSIGQIPKHSAMKTINAC